MAKEIERKFLVTNESFKNSFLRVEEIRQGYLSIVPERTVRIRTLGNKGYITVKTRNIGMIRSEWEYEIPFIEACEILDEAAFKVISKTRYFVKSSDSKIWEVDCFHGAHEGLVIAEIELESEDTSFELPDFVGKEITGDSRYYNSNLSTQA